MANRINKNDHSLLSHIANYRVLSVRQLVAISHRSPQVIRRRLRALETEAFLARTERRYGKSRGRPEEIVLLTDHGVDFLLQNKLLSDRDVLKTETDISPFLIDHELLLNWFRIHLLNIETAIPKLSVNYLKSTSSPFRQRGEAQPFPKKRRHTHNTSIEITQFIPDGIFSITHKETMKTLLFFLEVDMGTETLASLDRSPHDIRQKILGYQELFRSRRYKAFERAFDTKLNGFRLLFLSAATNRLNGLSRIVKQMPPADFIWLTDQSKMFRRGLTAEIWVRGGTDEDHRQSILGAELACDAPLEIKGTPSRNPR